MSLQRFTCNTENINHKVSCEQELGRVRGVILFDEHYNIDNFIEKLMLQTSEGDVEVVDLLIDACNNGLAYIIPKTTGTFDGGKPTTGDGYFEDEVERVLYNTYTLEFKDPDFKENVRFWSSIEKRRWNICWRTESLLHFSKCPVSIQANSPIEEDLLSAIVWNINATWKSYIKPVVAPVSAIKKYFEGKWQYAEPWTVDNDGYLLTDDNVVNGQLESSGVVINNYLQKEQL